MNLNLSALLMIVLAGAISASAAAAPALSAAAAASGSDLAKEQRWREQIVDTLVEGEAVDLHAGDLTFLGLYTEAEGPGGAPSRRAAIVVHGIGVHPDWPQVVHP